MRKSKVQGYLDVAKEIAERSPCTRRKFGAIIVKDDMIIATGYNGTIRGALNCGIDTPCLKDIVGEAPYLSYEYCPAVHAEQNACLIAGRERAIGGTLYLAPALGQGDRPCQKCRRAIVQVGISKVIYIGKDGSIQEDDVNFYVKLEDEWMMKIIDEYDPNWAEGVFMEDVTTGDELDE